MPRIVRFHEVGGPEVLKIEDLPEPPLAEREVRLKVQAIGLNRAEAMFREGKYHEQPTFPSRIGYEASGTIEEIGSGVREFKPGDRVSSIPAFSMRQYGAYGESVVLPKHALSGFPDRLNYQKGASIWMQYLTAFGLIEFGKMHSANFVLITAAASSVGLAAIQIARAVGAIPIATTRNPSKEKNLAEFGASFVVNTSDRTWADRIKEITDGRGADLVFDPMAGPAFEQLVKAVRPEGTIFVYGLLSPEPTPLPVGPLIGKHGVIRGYTLRQIVEHPDRFARAKRWVIDRLTDGTLDPVIAKVFPFEQVIESHRYMESNEQMGKIVLAV